MAGEILIPAKLFEAAHKLGLCGPDCALTTMNDTTDALGERTIAVQCSTHGPKTTRFLVPLRPVMGVSMLMLGRPSRDG